MRVFVTDNIRQITQDLDSRFKSQLPFAIAKSLTDAAKVIQSEIPQALDRALSQPKPYTKRGTFVSAATKYKPIATVGFKQRQAQYMALQVSGGIRKRKIFEQRLGADARGALAIPAKGVRLDSYGNISKAQIAQIMKGIKGEGKGKAKQYFLGKPGGRPGDAPTGIYARVDGGKRVVPLLLFTNTARYRKRFNFIGLAQKVVSQRYDAIFEKSLRAAIAAMR